MERTFLMVKPDAVKKRLIGEIIKRIEKASLKIVAMKITNKGIKIFPDQEVFGLMDIK